MQCSISTTTVCTYVFTRALFCVPVVDVQQSRALIQLLSLMISLRLRLRLRLSPAVGICTRRRIGRNFNSDAGDALGQRQPYRKHTAHRSFFPSSGSGQPHALAVVSHSSAQTAASVPAAAGIARRGP